MENTTVNPTNKYGHAFTTVTIKSKKSLIRFMSTQAEYPKKMLCINSLPCFAGRLTLSV